EGAAAHDVQDRATVFAHGGSPCCPAPDERSPLIDLSGLVGPRLVEVYQWTSVGGSGGVCGLDINTSESLNGGFDAGHGGGVVTGVSREPSDTISEGVGCRLQVFGFAG